MALVLNDRVKESTTTTGTGTVTLGGAVQGFETFAAGIGNSNTTYYCIQLGSEFEVGLGTLASDSSTLARTTIISSSNSDSAVNFSAGTKFVFCTMPASKSLVLDASNNITLPAKLIMPDVTSGKILVGDGTSYEEVAVSGDVTIASSGAITIANNAVETAMINADAVTGAKIADDAINSEHYTDGSIDTAHIADSQITNAKMADNAIDTAEIAASAVETAKINDAAVTTAKITDGNVTTAKIAADAVTQAKIADDAVGADQLGANAVVNASIASSAAIADSKLATISTAGKVSIDALEIDGASEMGAALADADLLIVDDGAGGTEKSMLASRIPTYVFSKVSGDATVASNGALTIAAQAVENSMLADDAVGADELAANAVVTASIVDDNVTQAKIADDAVGADQLAASAVVTASIVDDNVTQAKIADDAVGADQLAANAVVNASVASGAAIADTKLATISTANKVDIGALDIDGASDIGAALADADLIIVDDGAGGTEKKCEVSRIKTYIADVTLTTAAQTNITSLGTLTALTVSGIITANAKLDLNGTELILDVDADTSITADTDDQIDFRIGGADVMEMNATAFSGGAIYENADDITANYSITAGKNAFSVGPITVASGVTVTVPSGQRWVIL